MTRALPLPSGLVGALVVALLGCGPPPPPAPPPRAGSHMDRAVWTGDVSEEEFARLHRLSTAEVPPLRGESVELDDGSRAYLSLPEGDAPHPAVLVIHEWWGLNANIRHWTDRLAADGYAALAVDLYAGRTATNPDVAIQLMREVDDAAALRTLEAATRFLDADPRVRAPRRAVIGWCFGGGWSLGTGVAIPGYSAVVMYYGRPITDVERLRALQSPLLAIFGNRDTSIPPPRVDEFDRALNEAGVPHRILRFDAVHAFANPSSDHYDPASATAAWDAVRAQLAEALR
ncbi:MAG: dienelactone hydrolase family protein [Sandaracinaceae bacterium]